MEALKGTAAGAILDTLGDAEKQYLLGKVKGTVTGKVFDGQFWRDEDKRMLAEIEAAIVKDLPGMFAKGELGKIVALPEDKKKKDEADTRTDFEKVSDFAADELKKPTKDWEKTAADEVVGELKRAGTSAGGTETVSAEVAEAQKKAAAAVKARLQAMGTPEGMIPAGEEGIKAMYAAGVPAHIMYLLGVRPDQLLTVARGMDDEEHATKRKEGIEASMAMVELERDLSAPPEAPVEQAQTAAQQQVAQSQFVGTSAAIGETYHAMSRGEIDEDAVKKASDGAVTRLKEMGLIPADMDVRLAHKKYDDDDELPANQRVTIEVGVPKNGAVASYEQQEDGSYKLIVSAGAADHHVERAIAHELAEIKRLRAEKKADNAGFADALRPGSKAEDLSPHDEGRVAELKIMKAQLERGDVPVAELREELKQAVLHLGLVGPGSEDRRALLAKYLDGDTALLDMIDEHVTVSEKGRPSAQKLMKHLESVADSDEGVLDPAAVLASMKDMTPNDRLLLEAEYNKKLIADGETSDKPTFMQMLESTALGPDRDELLRLMDTSRRSLDPTFPLRDPIREAAVTKGVTDFRGVIDRITEGATAADVIKAVSNIQSKEEADRFFQLAEDAFGPGYNREYIKQRLAKRLDAGSFAVVMKYLEGDPVEGAKAEIKHILGDKEFKKESKRLYKEAGVGWFARNIQGPVAAATGLLKFAKGKLLTPNLDEPERMIAALGRLDPAARARLLEDEEWKKKIQPEAMEEFTTGLSRAKKGALLHKFRALMEEDPYKRQAALLAAHMQQCMEGKKQLHDIAGKLVANRGGVEGALDAAAADPHLFREMVLAYGKHKAQDEGNSEGPWPDYGKSLERMKADLGKTGNLYRFHERDIVPFHESDAERAQAAFKKGLLQKVARAELDAKHEELLGKLGLLKPGHKYSSEDLQEWMDVIARDDHASEQLREVLAAHGIGVDSDGKVDKEKQRAELEAYASGLRENELEHKAQMTVAALLESRPDAALTHLANPTQAAKRQALQEELDAGTLSKAEALVRREEIEAIDKRLKEDRDKVEARINKILKGSDTTLNDLIGRFGDVETHEGRMLGLGANKARWLREVLEHGDLQPHQKIFMALQGVGRDEPVVLQALSTQSPAQIAVIRKKYFEEFGEDLETRLLEEFSGDKEAAVKVVLKGDPKLLFDPKTPPEDPVVAKDAAEQRLAAHVAVIDEVFGGERKGGVRQAYRDAEEAIQHKMGFREKTGSHLDELQTRIKSWIEEHRELLVEDRDPATWARLEKLVEFQKAAATSHGQWRGDVGKSLVRSVGKVGTLGSFGISAGALAIDPKLWKLGATVAKWGAQGFGQGGMTKEEWLQKGLGVGIADVADDVAGGVINTVCADLNLSPAEKKEFIKVLKTLKGDKAVEKAFEHTAKQATDAKTFRSDKSAAGRAVEVGGRAAAGTAGELPGLAMGAATGQVKEEIFGKDKKEWRPEAKDAEEQALRLVEHREKGAFDETSGTLSKEVAAASKQPFKAEAPVAVDAASVAGERAEAARLATLREAARRLGLQLGHIDDATAAELYKTQSADMLVALGVPPDKLMALAMEESRTTKLQEMAEAPETDRKLAVELVEELKLQRVGNHAVTAAGAREPIKEFLETERPDYGTAGQEAYDSSVTRLAGMAAAVMQKRLDAEAKAGGGEIDPATKAALEEEQERLVTALTAFRRVQENLKKLEDMEEGIDRDWLLTTNRVLVGELAAAGGEEFRSLHEASQLMAAMGGENAPKDPKSVKKALRKFVGVKPPQKGSLAGEQYELAVEKLQRKMVDGTDPHRTVEALSAFREYQLNLNAMQGAPLAEVARLQDANVELLKTLKWHDIPVLPVTHNRPDHIQSALRSIGGVSVDLTSGHAVTATVKTENGGSTRVMLVIDETATRPVSAKRKDDGWQVRVSATYTSTRDLEQNIEETVAEIVRKENERTKAAQAQSGSSEA
jgi:hypothetical protein